MDKLFVPSIKKFLFLDFTSSVPSEIFIFKNIYLSVIGTNLETRNFSRKFCEKDPCFK